MPETRAPSLAATLAAAVRAGLLDCHTAIPGRIVSYDAAKQQADVQPLIKVAREDEEHQQKMQHEREMHQARLEAARALAKVKPKKEKAGGKKDS